MLNLTFVYIIIALKNSTSFKVGYNLLCINLCAEKRIECYQYNLLITV